MSAYAICFRVADPTRKAQLVQRIKSFGPWMSYFDGVWLIDAPYSLQALEADLSARINTTDSLLILGINPQVSGGWLPQEAWDWLNERG